MNKDLEQRLNTLEARHRRYPMAIIIIRPGEDNQTAVARYYAERGETPPDPDAPSLHVLISRDDSETRDAYR